MAAIAGLRGTGDWGTDERPKNFREFILFRNPNGTAPLTALMSKMSSESLNDPEFSWWDEPNDLVRLRLNDATFSNVDTAVVVDSADPDATNPEFVWGTAEHLKIGDLLLVEIDAGGTVTEVAAYDNEIVRVTAVTSATAFTVARSQAGTTAAAGGVPDNTFFTLIGSAYEEGSAAANATTRNPIKFNNLCQIFKTSYEITKTALKTFARTGKVESNDKKRKVFDHSRQLELSMMFGTKFETTANGQPLRFMGGLREFIPTGNTTIFGATTTFAQYLTAVEPVFDFDTPAGDERIVFCGNGYLTKLNELAKLNGNIEFGPVIKQFGMNLRSFIMPQGTLFLRTHPLMNRHAYYQNSAFIIDASALRYRFLRDTMSEDNIQTPGDDRKMGQWLTEASLEVRYAGLTLGYHGDFTAAA